jgi:hypothetical protein
VKGRAGERKGARGGGDREIERQREKEGERGGDAREHDY